MENTSKDVVVAYSCGPDAAALFLKLREVGCNPIPVYISYRANVGGKTAKDIRYAQQALGITGDTLEILRAPLDSSFHEKLYNRGPAHTTLLALGAPPRH